MIIFYYGKLIFVGEYPPATGGYFFLEHSEWTKIRNKSPEAIITFLNVKQVMRSAEIL